MKSPFALPALLLAVLFLASSLLFAEEPTVREDHFKVSGVCSLCKKRIEKAVAVREVKYARWNKSNGTLMVAYLTPTITLDSLQQRVAAVGHDTEKYRASDSVYAALPSCCLYRDGVSVHAD